MGVPDRLWVLADGLAYPLAYSVARTVEGQFDVVAHAIFLALAAAALPPLMRSAHRLSEAEHVK